MCLIGLKTAGYSTVAGAGLDISEVVNFLPQSKFSPPWRNFGALYVGLKLVTLWLPAQICIQVENTVAFCISISGRRYLSVIEHSVAEPYAHVNLSEGHH